MELSNGRAAYMKPLDQCRLYTFVDTAYLAGRSPIEVARQLCEGGSDIIQLRAKGSSRKEILGIANEIMPITRDAGVWLVINDYPDVAMAVGAPLCHLGQEDFFGAGPGRTAELKPLEFGLSTHSPEQAKRALAAGPDYIAIGPVYTTPTKPTAKPVTLEYVRWAAANVRIPWFAIGGINVANVDEVLSAGAQRICVVSAILNSADIAATCAKFKGRLAAFPI